MVSTKSFWDSGNIGVVHLSSADGTPVLLLTAVGEE
uniref:Uncharacterized protein n=1 Tax=Arundo donax TaxID=35708 RepID=A0A0A9AJ50_ARUDO